MNIEPIIGYYRKVRSWVQGGDAHERTLELVGTMLANQNAGKCQITSLHEVEFRVFSQWGDDGIIQWLVAKLPSLPKRFVEFGVEDYSESNTRFLMSKNNWCGLVMDGSPDKIARLCRKKWFWKYELTAIPCFVTRENVNAMIANWSVGEEIGLLHIDVDGNDYWLWDAITCTLPGIVIMEYNALFGAERAITIPYTASFQRHKAHYSGQYAGASLAALTHLAATKGYALIGSNSAGNNAYFLRTDLLSDELREMTVAAAFVKPNFRESRNQRGRLNYLPYDLRQASIRGLPVINVVTGQIESF
ncbi:conserved hypothetical protein [Gammaproteobacteria bacterium]